MAPEPPGGTLSHLSQLLEDLPRAVEVLPGAVDALRSRGEDLGRRLEGLQLERRGLASSLEELTTESRGRVQALLTRMGETEALLTRDAQSCGSALEQASRVIDSSVAEANEVAVQLRESAESLTREIERAQKATSATAAEYFSSLEMLSDQTRESGKAISTLVGRVQTELEALVHSGEQAQRATAAQFESLIESLNLGATQTEAALTGLQTQGGAAAVTLEQQSEQLTRSLEAKLSLIREGFLERLKEVGKGPVKATEEFLAEGLTGANAALSDLIEQLVATRGEFEELAARFPEGLLELQRCYERLVALSDKLGTGAPKSGGGGPLGWLVKVVTAPFKLVKMVGTAVVEGFSQVVNSPAWDFASAAVAIFVPGFGAAVAGGMKLTQTVVNGANAVLDLVQGDGVRQALGKLFHAAVSIHVPKLMAPLMIGALGPGVGSVVNLGLESLSEESGRWLEGQVSGERIEFKMDRVADRFLRAAVQGKAHEGLRQQFGEEIAGQFETTLEAIQEGKLDEHVKGLAGDYARQVLVREIGEPAYTELNTGFEALRDGRFQEHVADRVGNVVKDVVQEQYGEHAVGVYTALKEGRFGDGVKAALEQQLKGHPQVLREVIGHAVDGDFESAAQQVQLHLRSEVKNQIVERLGSLNAEVL